MNSNNNIFNKEEIFDNIFNSSFIAVLIVDEKRNNILVNDKLCEMFGYSKEEILKTNAKIFHINDEHFKNFGKIAFEHVIKKEAMSINYEFIKKDGKRFWAKISGDPIKNKNYVLWTLIDIDESIKSKNYLQSIFDNFPFLIWLKDINSKFLMANKNLLFETKRKGKEDIQGKNNFELFTKKNAQKYLAEDKKVIESKKVLRNEELLVRNGKNIWISTYKAPIFDEKNNVSGTIGFAREITKEKELEEKNKEISERLTLALEGTSDGLWDWNLETNQIYFSPKYKKMLGYEDNELKNEYSSWEKLLHPDYLSYCLDYYSLNLKNHSLDFELNFEMKHKDGHYVPILSRAKKVINKDNKVVRLVGTHIDMTEINKIKNKLLEQTELLKTVINEIPYPVILKNYDGKFILVNTATANLYQTTANEMIGKDDSAYVPDKQMAENFKINVQEIMDKNETKIVYENSIDLKTNKTRHYMSIKKPFKNKIGEKFILVLANDITELNEKNKEIRNKERLLHQQSKMVAMGEMIGSIAHQWRQPLSIITTAATGLLLQQETNSLSDQSLRNMLLKINETSQYLSKTIDDFRNYFNNKKEAENCTIKDIWKSALRILSLRIENSDIHLIEDLDSSELFTNKNELIQIFINILDNSLDVLEKSKNKKYIKITLENIDDTLIIKIIDNAGGIDEKIITKIFEPYFTTKFQSQGTGIGLFMCEEIIVKHLKGQISVKNKELEIENQKYKGTQFTITLPKKVNLN